MKNSQTSSNGSHQSTAGRVAGVVLTLTLFAVMLQGRDDHRGGGNCARPPHVPAGLEVPAGNELAAHASGVGVQIYVWTINPTNAALASWVFKAPHAVLFGSHHEDENVVGIHFAGPTWEDNDGSKVVGARVASVTVHSNAIPWLLLQASSTSGDGAFTGTTFIQRLNTVGGLAPSASGNTAGEEALVPYIADYYFYRTNH